MSYLILLMTVLACLTLALLLISPYAKMKQNFSVKSKTGKVSSNTKGLGGQQQPKA
jgi:hypothetical protein